MFYFLGLFHRFMEISFFIFHDTFLKVIIIDSTVYCGTVDFPFLDIKNVKLILPQYGSGFQLKVHFGYDSRVKTLPYPIFQTSF